MFTCFPYPFFPHSFDVQWVKLKEGKNLIQIIYSYVRIHHVQIKRSYIMNFISSSTQYHSWIHFQVILKLGFSDCWRWDGPYYSRKATFKAVILLDKCPLRPVIAGTVSFSIDLLLKSATISVELRPETSRTSLCY